MIKRLLILIAAIGLVVAACGASPGELAGKVVELARQSGSASESGAAPDPSALPSVAGQAVSAIPTQTHTVQPGDTLSGIAVAYSADVDTIIALNADDYPVLAENPRALQVGWALLVPEVSYVAVVPTAGAPAQSEVEAQVSGTSSDDAPAAPAEATAAPAPDAQAPPSIHGSPEFVAAVEATLTWLAEHDSAALKRVRDYVDVISVETQPGRYGSAHIKNQGSWCEARLVHQELLGMVFTLYHEASHCYLRATQGYVNPEDDEAFATSETIEFRRRHGY